MIIPGRGGGVAGFFFSMLQTQLFGSIKAQNKHCIKLEVSILDYFQYKWPYRSCSFTLFRRGMTMITDSMVFFKAFHNQSWF